MLHDEFIAHRLGMIPLRYTGPEDIMRKFKFPRVRAARSRPRTCPARPRRTRSASLRHPPVPRAARALCGGVRALGLRMALCCGSIDAQSRSLASTSRARSQLTRCHLRVSVCRACAPPRRTAHNHRLRRRVARTAA